MKSIFRSIVVAIITWQAKVVLRKYKPKIVAVTGSVGKTSTKDAIFTVLSHFYYVRKSEKSFNSEIGVPLTILGCPNGWSDPIAWLKNIIEGFTLILLPNHYPKWLVLEVGADRPGDIESITKWLIPDISVITRLSKVPVHVEYFADAQAVFKEKGFLAKALKKDGVLILNADDEDVLAYRSMFEGRIVLYGTSEVSDVIGFNYEISYEDLGFPKGVKWDVSVGEERGEAVINGGLGVQQMYPALAAIAVGVSQKLSLEKMLKTFADHKPSRGRMKILYGIKDSIIIDDTYNSSPVAASEAIRTLELVKNKGKKIAILGDMLELGVHSTEEHRKIGEQVASVADVLVTVGVRSRATAEGALGSGLTESNVFQYEDSRIAGKETEHIIAPGDVILIKGSQGVRMEKAVEELLRDPLQKDRLLVRQDAEWQNR
jgi:UDP-N-acetylmuramoyl-tripeptide--D-alanyl-D-alanine ligase